MKKHLLFLVITIISIQSYSQIKVRSYIQDPLLAPREHNVDMLNMRLEISLEPAKGLVKGKVTHIFNPLRPTVDSVFLDAPGITIKEVTVNGKPAKFKTNNEGVTVFTPSLSWNTKDSMSLTYEASPRKGLYFVGWNDPNNISRKQVWSQGQGIDNRCWIPMYDEMNDRLITEVIISFDKDYKVLSNGTKLSEKINKDGTKTWHYKMTHPHAPYLTMLGIGKYDIKEVKSTSGVPEHLYYYPEWKDRVETTYLYSTRMIDFFEKETNVPYGWESYSQIPVQDYMFGAMENTTATVYGDFFFVDKRGFLDRNYVSVNAHELAHQWFGDLVTARSDAHHWLQESFATYYNQLFEREVFGQDHFDFFRHATTISALDESKKNFLPVANSEAGSIRHYPKGAYVLNMLKYVVGGKEVYNKAIKYYLEKHKYGNVDSHDLLIAFEETTGMSLDWFWDQWIYKGGEPHYRVSSTEGNGYTQVSVTQAQELSDITGLPAEGTGEVDNSVVSFTNAGQAKYRQAGLYKMPIWFEVHYIDGSMDKKLAWVEQQTELVNIPNSSGKKVSYVLFDPNSEVLKEVTFGKNFEMLKSQALNAKNMLDRLAALEDMRNVSIDQKRDILKEVYAKEKFHATKAEIISQLAGDDDSKSRDLLRAALNDKDVMVRKSAMNNIKKISTDLLADYEKLLTDSSYDVVTTSLDKLCRQNPSKTTQYLEATKGVEGVVGRNVLVKWLEISYSASADKKFIQQLADLSSNSYEFRTRANAMGALKRSNYMDRNVAANMVDALLSPNSRLSGPADDALKYFFEQGQFRKIIADYISSQKWESWQKKILAKYS
jgi:aminopeptidase N